MLQRNFKDGDQKMAHMLQKMNMQISRLNFLVKDLLDVTRIEGNKLRFNRERFEFNGMVKEVTEDMQILHSSYNLILDLAEAVEVCYDKERIIQVLTNLIANAIKYSPVNKDIYISINNNGKEITCTVKDYGIGIPKEVQKDIFERFYQVMDGKINSFPGLGLGLYISAEIIKRQNGNIWVKSEWGEGSTFYFSLPLN
jgi:signal transduction histidine kinase